MRHKHIHGKETELLIVLQKISLPWSFDKAKCIDQQLQLLMKSSGYSNLINIYMLYIYMHTLKCEVFAKM